MKRFWWLKAIGGPGSTGFFIVVAAIAVAALLRRRTRRAGKILVAALLVTYTILSLPVVASSFVPASSAARLEDVVRMQPFDEIFALDGDDNAARAELAMAVDRVIKVRNVWGVGTGDVWGELKSRGFPEERLRIAYGDTTYLQVVEVRKLMKYHEARRAVLITSRSQAQRVARVARRARGRRVAGS